MPVGAAATAATAAEIAAAHKKSFLAEVFLITQLLQFLSEQMPSFWHHP